LGDVRAHKLNVLMTGIVRQFCGFVTRFNVEIRGNDGGSFIEKAQRRCTTHAACGPGNDDHFVV
jgi:hypothetical protein